jgi:uncharacterized membrane protein YraQ (UPF0718 family)
MAKIFAREFIYFRYYFDIQFRQIAGYWVLGMVLGSAISVFGKEKIHKLFAALQKKKLGVLGLIPASLIGIASPLCMYGTIPIAASFSEKGIEDDWLAAFMMGSILLNPQLLFYSAALGPAALLIRFVTCFVCGVAAGLCVRYRFKNQPTPPQSGRGMVGSAKYGLYAGLIPTQTNTLAGLKPLANKEFFNFAGFTAPVNRDIDPNPALRFFKNLWRNIKLFHF